MVTMETPTSDAPPQHRTRVLDVGMLGAFVVTGVVVAVCAVVMVNWDAGLPGDLLLGAAAIGVVFRIPHTVPVWAALTLLAATALALSFNGEALASRFADLAYYGLAVGCLWAIWDLALERLRWRLPGTALHERLVRTKAYTLGAAVLLVACGLAGAALAYRSVGLVGLLLAVLAVIGVILDLSYVTALCGGVTLAVCSFLLYASGQNTMTVRTGLLASGAFVAALLWVCWQALVSRFGLRWRREGRPPTASATADGHEVGKERPSFHV